MRSFAILFFIIILIVGGEARAELRLPGIFSDGMVLQRDIPVRVWGWAETGAKVEIEFAGQSRTALTGESGRWDLALDPMPASLEPRVLTARSDKDEEITVRNVLVGEVWFTAGQSNMMMGLAAATGGPEFFASIPAHELKNIRVVNQLGPELQSPVPVEDIPAAWGAPGAEYSAVSFWFAHKLLRHLGGQVPVGMITYTVIAPAEAWIDRPTLEADPRLSPVLKDALQLATKSYNGVIHPITPFSLRGILYYQAEYNGFGERGLQFRAMMPTLIETWRREWGRPDLPFLFVQLPGFVAPEAPGSEIDMDPATLAAYKLSHERGTWTDVRESQLMTWQSVPHTGMAITIDVGESYDIHPPNKEPVADRLLLQARHVAYGEELIHSGPVPRKTIVKDGGFEVTFDHAGEGLAARGGELLGFEVAGADLVFHPANATISGENILIKSASVEEPVHLRYAWDGNPVATLVNSAGLPATPFRFSDWSKAHQPAKGGFAFPNADFEELDAKGSPLWWNLKAGAELTTEKASQGKNAIRIPQSPQAVLDIKGIVQGTGLYWNCPPLKEAAIRPGSLVTYSVDLAKAGGSGEGNAYLNLCQDASASGYQAWGGTRNALIESSDFVRRTVVQLTTDQALEAFRHLPDSAGARFLNQSSSPETTLWVDNFSPVEIVRPLLQISSQEPFNFGEVAKGAEAISPERTITNGQMEERTQTIKDGEWTTFATVLYGAASFAQDGTFLQQKVVAPTDHVAAVLIGENADVFEIAGAKTGEAKRHLELLGDDGKGGLRGGSEPEKETFALRFVGAPEAGAYACTLRVVTQAGNLGVLSQGEPGEPPVNLYYFDIPVQATVK